MLRLQSSAKSTPAKQGAGFIPPPFGGMNTSSPTLLLPKTDAATLRNIVCKTSGVFVRAGTAYRTTTSLANDPKSLHTYAAVGGTSSVFTTTDAGVFDVTGIAAAPAASIALTNGFTIGAVLSTGAQNYLTLVNGTDSMVQYDGAVWSSIATVGGGAINTNTFSYVEVYRQRLFFIVENTTRLVYLTANSPSAGGTTYDTAAIFKRGGYLVAAATWTVDGGTGPDDHIVLATSEGELAVFVGNDPATWTYRGTYYIAPPMGKRPFIKFGGDLLFLSQQGLYPLSKALLVATLDRQVAISEKIAATFVQLGAAFGTSEKWNMVIDFSIPALLISTPNSTILGMNTQTNAWFEFSSSAWSPTCIGALGSTVFFGSVVGATRRILYFTSNSDDVGTAITCQIQWGLMRFSPNASVRVDNFQPLWALPPSSSSTITGDFQLGAGAGLATFSNTNTSLHTRETAWFSLPDVYSTFKAPLLNFIISADTSSFRLDGIAVAYKIGALRQQSGIAWTV